MLKKVAVVAALVAGFSWCTAASASAQPITDAQAQAGVQTQQGVQMRTYDLHNQADVTALLSLILGLDLDVSADVDASVDADVKADVDADVDADVKAKVDGGAAVKADAK